MIDPFIAYWWLINIQIDKLPIDWFNVPIVYCGIIFVHNQGVYLYKCKPTYGNANNFHIFGIVFVVDNPSWGCGYGGDNSRPVVTAKCHHWNIKLQWSGTSQGTSEDSSPFLEQSSRLLIGWWNNPGIDLYYFLSYSPSRITGYARPTIRSFDI